eukprot:9486795-Pyramimonas_sp.AAC.1
MLLLVLRFRRFRVPGGAEEAFWEPLGVLLGPHGASCAFLGLALGTIAVPLGARLGPLGVGLAASCA